MSEDKFINNDNKLFFDIETLYPMRLTDITVDYDKMNNDIIKKIEELMDKGVNVVFFNVNEKLTDILSTYSSNSSVSQVMRSVEEFNDIQFRNNHNIIIQDESPSINGIDKVNDSMDVLKR